MARRGGVKVYIDGDTTGLDRALRSSEGRLGKFGQVGGAALRGITTAGIALGAAGAAGIIYSVNAASDLGEEMSKTAVVFGKSGREVQRWSKTTADAFGISRREALASAGVFGNMLVPMGLARDRAADMSKTMVGLAGDMSSFNNASPQETLDALRAGLAGETEPLRRFGVFLDAARIKQEAVNLGLADGTGELTAAAKAQATYALILKDTKDAQGDAARTGDQLAGGMRRLKAQADDVASSLGTMFIPPLESGLAFVNNQVLPGLQGAANDLAAIWERPDISPQKALEESWKVIEETGFPDAAKEAIYQGISLAATNAPKVFLRGLQEAPWPAKAVLAGIFLAKFGPGLQLAGAGLGKVFGKSTGVGALGAGGGVGLAAAGRPVPVVVTNPGFGGAAGRAGAVVATTAAGRRIPMVGGVVGGGLVPGMVPAVASPGMWSPTARAVAGRGLQGAAAGIGVGSLAYMGLNAAGAPGGLSSVLSGVAGGAATGATMGAAAGPWGAVAGGLAGAAIGGLTQGFREFGGSGEIDRIAVRTEKVTNRLAQGLSDNSRQRIEREVKAAQEAYARLEKVRGRNILEGTGAGFLPPSVVAERRRRQLEAEAAPRAQHAGAQRTVGLRVAKEFVAGLDAGAQSIAQADLWKAVTKRFDGMGEEGRKAGAATVIKWAQAAEREGRLPRGSADKLVRDLRRKYGELEDALPDSARKAMRQFNAELGAKGATRNAGRVLDSLKDSFSDAPRFTKTTMDNVGRQYARAIDFLTEKSKSGTDLERKNARRLLAEVKDAWGKIGAANRELGKSYDAPRAAAGRLKLSLQGAAAAAVTAWSSAATSIESSTSQLAADIEAAMRRIDNASNRRPRRGGGAAGGGFTGWTPGVYTGRDPYMLRVDGDEAILNPRQQEMIPGGRSTLERIFAYTGGVVSGGFAGGGFVNPVPGGNWKYGPGGGTHSRGENGYVWQDDDAWDIMGSDGMSVVAGFDGVIGRISPFNSDPRYWGHGLYLQGSAGTLFYKHLKSVNVASGARVSAGTKLGVLGDGVNGGAHLHLGAQPLSLLSALRSGRAVDPASGGHQSTKEEREATPRQKLVETLKAAGITGKQASGIASRALGASADLAGSVTATTGRGDLAGQRAALAASSTFLRPGMGAKMSPEDEDSYIEQQVNKAEKKHLTRDLARVQGGLKKISDRMADLSRDEKTIRKRGKGKRGPALAAIRTGLAKLRSQRRALLEVQTHVLARLAEIGESAAAYRAEDIIADVQFGDTTMGLLEAIEGAGDFLSAAGRDDSLQDKQTAKAATAQAQAEGITNPQMIEAFSERAVLDRRKGEIDGLAGQVKALYDKVVAEQARLRKNWSIQYRNLQRTPRKKRHQRQNYRDAIARINAALEILDGQEVGLLEQYHDLQAQSAELGFDLGELNAQITGMPRLDPALAVDAPTEADYIDAEIAEAGLTETLDDDLAAAEKQELALHHAYNRAKQGGDPREIAPAANALVAARSNVKGIKEAMQQLTAATKEQTEAERKAKEERDAALRRADISDAFIRTAFSPGDINTGGRFAADAAGGVININTLLPSDPRTLEAIQRALSAAGWNAGVRLTKTTLLGL